MDKIEKKDLYVMYEVCCEWCNAKIRMPKQQDAWNAANTLKWAFTDMEQVFCYSCKKLYENCNNTREQQNKKIRKKDVKRVFVLVCIWCGDEITSTCTQNVCISANKLKWEIDRTVRSEEKYSLCRICDEKFEKGEIK